MLAYFFFSYGFLAVPTQQHKTNQANKRELTQTVCDDWNIRSWDLPCFNWSGVVALHCRVTRIFRVVPCSCGWSVCSTSEPEAACSEGRGFPLKGFSDGQQEYMYFLVQSMLMTDSTQAQFSKIKHKLRSGKGLDPIARPLQRRLGSPCSSHSVTRSGNEEQGHTWSPLCLL